MDTPGNLQYVITGTGRCGTKFINRVLEDLGYKTGHQYIFRPGRGGPGSPETDPNVVELVRQSDIAYRVAHHKQSPWGPVVETSWLAVPYLGIPEMEGIKTVHLVRHPQKTIQSLAKIELLTHRHRYGLYYDFVHYWLPLLHKQGDPVQMAGYFYLTWNWLAQEKGTDLFWRVEDGPKGMLDALGIDSGDQPLFSEKDYNTRGGPHYPVTLDSFQGDVKRGLDQMARDYGYEWDR